MTHRSSWSIEPRCRRSHRRVYACSPSVSSRRQGRVSQPFDERPNQVLEWNQIFIDTLIATNTPNSSSQRLGAIVHTSIFDATTASSGATNRVFVQLDGSAGRVATCRSHRRGLYRAGGIVSFTASGAR